MVIGNCPFPDRFGPWVAPGLSAYRGPSIHMFDSCSAPARPDLVGQPCAAPRRAEPFDKGEVGGFAVDVKYNEAAFHAIAPHFSGCVARDQLGLADGLSAKHQLLLVQVRVQ